MARKPPEIPPEIAQEFVRDMRAFFDSPSQLEQDEIAARQRHALNEHRPPGAKNLRLADVKQLFLAMRDQV